MKKNKNIYVIYGMILFLVFIFCGCVSKRNCIKENDFCGMIVDENNRPVSDFVVSIKNELNITETAITNKSGLFMFPDIKSGFYFISGERENYVKLENKKYFFNGNPDLFCSQIISFEEAINKIESYIKVNNFQKADELLNKVVINENKCCRALFIIYKAYLNLKLENLVVYQDCLNLLKQIDNDMCRKIVKIMEEKSYE